MPAEVIGAKHLQVILHEGGDLLHRREALGKGRVATSREEFDVLHHSRVRLLEVLVVGVHLGSRLEVGLGQRSEVGVHGGTLGEGNLEESLPGVNEVLPPESPLL